MRIEVQRLIQTFVKIIPQAALIESQVGNGLKLINHYFKQKVDYSK